MRILGLVETDDLTSEDVNEFQSSFVLVIYIFTYKSLNKFFYHGVIHPNIHSTHTGIGHTVEPALPLLKSELG